MTQENPDRLRSWEYVPRQVDIPPLPESFFVDSNYISKKDAHRVMSYLYDNHPSLFLEENKFDDYCRRNPHFSSEWEAQTDYLVRNGLDPDGNNVQTAFFRIIRFDLAITDTSIQN